MNSSWRIYPNRSEDILESHSNKHTVVLAQEQTNKTSSAEQRVRKPAHRPTHVYPPALWQIDHWVIFLVNGVG